MDKSELEFVQIILILMGMTFMIIMIFCLLNHYWLSALDFLSRLSQTQRDQDAHPGGSEWPDSVLTQQRNTEVMCCKLNRSLPFIQQQHLCHLQPTCPYLQQEIINFPPIICLPDGEELLPYKGPCSLQLRPREQQLELIRATVHAPPNRTIFDGDLIDIYMRSESVQTPSSNSAASAARSRTEDPPPAYSEVMGDTACHSQHSNNAPPKGGRLGHDVSQTVFHAGSSESTTNASTDKNKSS